MSTNKILPREQLRATGEHLRQAGRSIVWTNGCFDLLHLGHVRSLQAARDLGDVLVVGLNSDSSVRRLKGTSRPILSEQDRAEMLAALACVDYVVVFDESTPEAALGQLRPHIHCKGADYAPGSGRAIPEAALVESFGGRVAFLPLVEGLSTTALIERLRGDCQ
jgi:rfaE bifunctional protein nucleotidyltransferase chain/domain